jgi:hypothetical protein
MAISALKAVDDLVPVPFVELTTRTHCPENIL